MRVVPRIVSIVLLPLLLVVAAARNAGAAETKEAVDKLKAADPSKPVKVVTIGVGRETNNDALSQISEATGRRSRG